MTLLGSGALAAGMAGWLVSAHRSAPGRAARLDEATGRGGEAREVLATDGTVLHVEVDGPDDADVTVVFCHGWLMDLTTWHRQREALEGSRVRRVFYDQRGHGRSGWAGMDPSERGVRQLAGDLAAVIGATAPTGRLVLVGHSMGGMTIMGFAQTHLSTIKERVDGVLLVATGAGPLSQQATFGIPDALQPLHRFLRRNAVRTFATLGRLPETDVRRLGVGPTLLLSRLTAVAPQADDRALAVTTGAAWRNRLDVAAIALAAVMSHDEREAVPAMQCTSVVTINPGRDRLIPPVFQRELAEMIPGARMVELPDSGHMAMLEAPDEVTRELEGLIARAESHP